MRHPSAFKQYSGPSFKVCHLLTFELVQCYHPLDTSSYPTILCTYATLSMVVFLFFLSIPLLLICWGRCLTPLCGAAPHHRIQTSPSLKLIEVPQWSPGMLKVGASLCTLSSWVNNNGLQTAGVSLSVTLLTHCFDYSNIIEYFPFSEIL